MLRSFLIGIVAGGRAMTPLAVLSDAARRSGFPAGTNPPGWLARPAVSNAARLLAAGERLGDKLSSAPDRIAPAGLIARLATGLFAGAVLAPPRRALAGGLLGAAAAVGAAYLTFGLRVRAMRRFGRTSTGMLEDGLNLGAAQLILRRGARSGARPRPGPVARLR